jgi:hypothetical protein
VVVLSGDSDSGSEDGDAPRTFYGVVSQTALEQTDFERMSGGGIGTLRIPITWSAADPVPDSGGYDWSTIDPIVLGAAEHGIRILPFLYGTPEWAASELDGGACGDGDCGPFAPRSEAALDAWGEFVGATVDRYGPGGDLWAENPDLGAQPIRAWQIWNEQNSATFYMPEPSIGGYVDLLAEAERAIRERDPEAAVVLGGMAGAPPDARPVADTAEAYLRELYETDGAAELFDGVASHPYASSVEEVESQLELLHEETIHAGDAEATLWVTELGWASGGPEHPLSKGPGGQAEQLRAVLEYLLERRLDWNIEGAIWYSWRDTTEAPVCKWCPTSGLLTAELAEKPAWTALTEFTGGS